MKIDTIDVPCGVCDGTGRVVHQRLSAVGRSLSTQRWRTTIEIARETGLGPTYTVGLLARLRKMGVAERRGGRGPRGYEWRLVQPSNALSREARSP